MANGVNHGYSVPPVTHGNHPVESLNQPSGHASTPVNGEQPKVNDALSNRQPKQKSDQQPDQSLFLSKAQSGGADGEGAAAKPPGTGQPLQSVQGNSGQMNSNDLDVSVSESMD